MIVNLSAQPGMVFYIEEVRFFLLKWEESLFAVPDACPHRGGPLSKGTIDPCKGTITCPMHELKTPIKIHLKKSLPLVRVGNEVKVIYNKEKKLE